jgi:hypothetical protein
MVEWEELKQGTDTDGVNTSPKTSIEGVTIEAKKALPLVVGEGFYLNDEGKYIM